jgi:hypothetical protein
LSLSDSFTQLTTGNQTGESSSSTSVTTTTYQGTDGTFQALNVTSLLNALAANPTAVQALFQGSNSLTNNLGTYLTTVTGLPTLLNSGTVGDVPDTGILSGFENANNAQIQNIQSQVTQITDNANQQANLLRQEFVSSESQIASYQALQSQLSGFFKSSGG